MDYFTFYGEIWQFHKKYHNSLANCRTQDERNMVCEMLINEGDKLNDKYKNDFAMDMILSIIRELDRTERKLRNGDKEN